MRRVIDSFLFFNELSMLRLRLEELDDVVDTFILVESPSTHSGNPKPLHFSDNKHMFAKFLHKIIHVVFDDLPPSNGIWTWTRENSQRNAITRAFSQLDIHPDDIFILSDLDEIPDTDTVRRLKSEGLPDGIHSLSQDLYYYNTTCKSPTPWTHAKIMEFRALGSSCDLNEIRMSSCPVLSPGGWHLSYFGNSEFIRTKIQSFAHDEFNTNYFTDVDRINKMIDGGTDLYERPGVSWVHVPVGTNTYLPKHIGIL